jgi:GTP-binding protein
MRSEQIRNVAIIAHVDHGKTSLVDTLLKAGRTFRANEAEWATCVMDRHDLEKERGITIFSKACAVNWRDHRINVIDTPGHADFGGEVERVLRMADAAVLVVCAHDGPMPQTRFVLRKALEHGLRVVILVNKVDRKDARTAEIADEVFSLLIDLGAPEELLDAPVLFASAREGKAARSMEEYATATNMSAVLDTLLERVPAPVVDQDGPVQLAVAQIDWDDYLGRLALGRVARGRIAVGQRLTVVKSETERKPFEVKKLFQYDGLTRVEIQEAVAGDIVLLAGIEEVDIGDTICHPEHPDALPRVHVDPPTVSMRFVATDSPFRGRDGDKVTSRQLRERLMREARANVALRVELTELPDQFEVKGRGLLHLGVLIEEMRREGYEFSVARPKVIERRGPDGERLEPIETCIVDVNKDYAGKVIEVLGTRRGELVSMNQRGDQVRVEFVIPSRGLIGIRATILNVSRGEANMNHQLKEYGPWRGPIPERTTGTMVSMETGRVTAYAIEALEARGGLFVSPGDEAYNGQIVGEHNKGDDIEVNICRARALTNVRSAGADRKIVLAVPRAFGVEDALAYVADDEYVEMTPHFIRLRKRTLDPVTRKRMARNEKREETAQA